ncbi:E3 ubiquitin-protein ligase TRIM39 [Chanos chanos]|uniref:E3 ubiquitin-protein ligase TRIM39 n=1 Tax=Chanos chanos TaxID=29144 RepID=A0A6J2V8M8_CHACN|nr:E3 ubiquitin-protein ligase TRIM39-like [Chanos chanos]
MKPQHQETLKKLQDCLCRQREAVKYRLRKLSARQTEITKKSTILRDGIQKKYDEMKKVLEEDCRSTLSLLKAEEKAAIQAVDDLIEKNCLMLKDIEHQLSELTEENIIRGKDMVRVFFLLEGRVQDLLENTDPGRVKLDEPKADQILSLTHNLLLFIRSQIPVTKRLLKSYSTDVTLDPDTAHPNLIISPAGDTATYTSIWQEVPEYEGRFDTTINVISKQCWDSGYHYWEVDVTGKTYWEIGLTYPTIPRKGRKEDCWLGRGPESWCVEFFNGDYTAWHRGVDHPLPITQSFTRIGIFCSFSVGLVSFLGMDNMTPLFSFCSGTFTDSLYLALCPGHDLQGANSKPIKIYSAIRNISQS